MKLLNTSARALAALCLLTTPVLLMALELEPNTIAVTGSAVTQESPDRVVVSFGVEVQAQSAGDALAGNSEAMQKVLESITAAGVGEDELSTSKFNIQPVYEGHEDGRAGTYRQVLVGYRVSNLINVETIGSERVARVIDAAVAAGANRVDRVAFFLSPDVRSRLQDELIEAAVLDARGKAVKALAPLGQVITGVRKVTLTDFSDPGRTYADAGLMEMVRSAPTRIFASDQEVKTIVEVTFIIASKEDAARSD